MTTTVGRIASRLRWFNERQRSCETDRPTLDAGFEINHATLAAMFIMRQLIFTFAAIRKGRRRRSEEKSASEPLRRCCRCNGGGIDVVQRY